MQIAMKELQAKKVPFIIRRFLPDGSCAALLLNRTEKAGTLNEQGKEVNREKK